MASEVEFGKAHAVAFDSDRLTPTQSGVFEKNILCARCDNELGKHENKAARAFRELRTHAAGLPIGIHVLTGHDGDDVVRFVAGVLWKYSVASERHGRIDLGPYQDKLQRIAFRGDPIDTDVDVILCRLRLHPNDDGVFAYRLPTPDTKDGVNGFRMMLGGIFIFMKTDVRCATTGVQTLTSIRGRDHLVFGVMPAQLFEEFRLPQEWVQSGRLSGYLDKHGTV